MELITLSSDPTSICLEASRATNWILHLALRLLLAFPSPAQSYHFVAFRLPKIYGNDRGTSDFL